MFKRLISIYICIMVMFINGCKNPIDNPIPEIKGKLSIIEGIPILHVWGTTYEQGFAQGYLLAETIVEFYKQVFIDRGGSEFRNIWQNEVLPNLDNMTIPRIYADELRGIFDGMESKLEGPVYFDEYDRNLTYEDLVAVQCWEDISKMQNQCSSFCAWGPMTSDGHTITGRNYDHPDWKCETDYRIIVVRSALSSGELAWVSYCVPTEIGCTTGINKEGVTISQHDGHEDFNSMNASNTIYPDGLVHRRAIETARAATAQNDVIQVFREWAIASSCIPMVTWPYPGDGPASVVYEMDSNRSIESGATVRDVESNTPYQITANYYYKRPTQSTPDYRYDLLDSHLSSIADSWGSQYVDRDYAWQLLGKAPADPSKEGVILVYSVVFEPNKMKMHIAVSENGEHAPSCKKVSFDITELFDGLN